MNVYNWVDYIGEGTIKNFEKKYNIKVVYDNYDASETVDAKLFAGNSGYDVVLHAGSFIPRLIQADLLSKIDKSRLKNYGNYDLNILCTHSNLGPGQRPFRAVYVGGTVGVTYNVDMIAERIPNAPLNFLGYVISNRNTPPKSPIAVFLYWNRRVILSRWGWRTWGLTRIPCPKMTIKKWWNCSKPI